MAGYICPFCGERFVLHEGTYLESQIGSDKSRVLHGTLGFRCDGTKNSPATRSRFHDCPNPECQKTSILVDILINDKVIDTIPIHPRVIMAEIPDYVPQAIRDDYKEACLILNDSPKAAAALCRRCLQGMIRDFHKVTESSLYKEIDKLNGEIRPDEWNSLNGIREIGNIGAHMENDVNLIIDIDKDEAQLLIDTIIYLIDAWYITRQKTAERNANLAKTQARIKQEKSQTKTRVPKTTQ